MRGNLIFGMIAGSLVGFAATMIALPYVQPALHKVIKRGKRVVGRHMDKMDPGWNGS